MLGPVQKRLLKWLKGKYIWRSISEIKEESNFRLDKNQIRAGLNGLVKKGFVMKEKSASARGPIFEYLITLRGRDYDGRKNMSFNFKEGDRVEVIGNAKGTAWESGVITDIDENGAVIDYSYPHGMYGLAKREPLTKLFKLKK